MSSPASPSGEYGRSPRRAAGVTAFGGSGGGVRRTDGLLDARGRSERCTAGRCCGRGSGFRCWAGCGVGCCCPPRDCRRNSSICRSSSTRMSAGGSPATGRRGGRTGGAAGGPPPPATRRTTFTTCETIQKMTNRSGSRPSIQSKPAAKSGPAACMATLLPTRVTGHRRRRVSARWQCSAACRCRPADCGACSSR